MRNKVQCQTNKINLFAKGKAFLLLILSFSLITCILLSLNPVNAEDVVYTSVGERYFHTNEGTVETFTDKKMLGYVLYNTEFTRNEGQTEGEVLFNALDMLMQAPMNLITDNPGAKAIVLKFESAIDSNKQICIISRNINGTCYVTVSLTDDIYFNSDYTCSYIGGTQQPTLGINGANYDSTGFTTGTPDIWGLTNRGEMLVYMIDSGDVYLNYSTSPANVLNEDFLTKSIENMSTSPYTSRYTSNYVSAMLTEFKNSFCKFSIKFYGMEEDKISFGLRQVNGFNSFNATTKADFFNGKENHYNIKSYPEQKVKNIIMNQTYALTDLIKIYSLYDTWYAAGFINSTTWDVSGTHYKFGSYTAGSQTNNITVPSTEGIYNIVVEAYNINGAYSQNTWIFTYNVIIGKPAISYIGEENLIAGGKYNLDLMFDVWFFGENPSIDYFIDNIKTEALSYTAVIGNHNASCTVTDSRGYITTVSKEINVTDANVPSSNALIIEQGMPEIFLVPALPDKARFSFALYNATDDIASAIPLTTDLNYVFTENGNYKLCYFIDSLGLSETLIYITDYNVTIVRKAPEIIVAGEYIQECYAGKTLQIYAASANNGFDDEFIVNVNVSFNNSVINFSNNELKLTNAGNCVITYSVLVDEDRTVLKEYQINVMSDEVKPQIILTGRYNDEYQIKNTINVLNVTVVDNSEANITPVIKVYLNEKEIDFKDNIFAPNVAGNYKIVYEATDFSGNKGNLICEFIVVGSSESFFSVIMANKFLILSICLLIGAGVVVYVLIRKTHKK